MKKIAIYPGSFDPLTNGHLDIIKRSSLIFDEVIILIAVNPNKKARFTLNNRINMIKDSIKEFDNVKVDYYEGLVIKYAKKVNAKFLIRGLRVAGDYEYEWRYYTNNRYIDESIDIVYLLAKPEISMISSTVIMDFVENNVDVSSLVPPSVNEEIKKLKK